MRVARMVKRRERKNEEKGRMRKEFFARMGERKDEERGRIREKGKMPSCIGRTWKRNTWP